MLKKHPEKHLLTPSTIFSYKIQQMYLFGRTQLVHESQEVRSTAQDQDEYVMFEEECRDLFYEKIQLHNLSK